MANANQPPPRPWWSMGDLRGRAIAYQITVVTAVGLIAWLLASNAAHNLEDRQIASGFGFLWREAGFAISESTFLSYNAADHYFRAIAVGLFNTLRVAALGVVLTTIIGALLGLARLSQNWLMARLAALYVELVRNVPLLVQLFFWYTVITENLPGPREALNPVPGVFVSNRGLAFPFPQTDPILPWLYAAAASGLIIAWGLVRWAKRRQALTGQDFPALTVGVTLVVGLPTLVYLAAGAPLRLSFPVLRGFNFSGGGVLSPEFSALLIGLVVYTAAFVAEIVRAGVLAVDRGQFEAASSLGLKRRQTMRLVILPQALRVIVPPLTSQYLNLTKNSSLAVAIGYPDLVSIANTTMNQTGQAIEGIAVIMLVYLTVSLMISLFMNRYNRRIALRGGRS